MSSVPSGRQLLCRCEAPYFAALNPTNGPQFGLFVAEVGPRTGSFVKELPFHSENLHGQYGLFADHVPQFCVSARNLPESVAVTFAFWRFFQA